MERDAINAGKKGPDKIPIRTSRRLQAAAEENGTHRGCGPQVTYNHINMEASNCGL